MSLEDFERRKRSAQDIQEGKVAGLDLSIKEAERLLALAEQIGGYHEAYLCAFREFLIYARAMKH